MKAKYISNALLFGTVVGLGITLSILGATVYTYAFWCVLPIFGTLLVLNRVYARKELIEVAHENVEKWFIFQDMIDK